MMIYYCSNRNLVNVTRIAIMIAMSIASTMPTNYNNISTTSNQNNYCIFQTTILFERLHGTKSVTTTTNATTTISVTTTADDDSSSSKDATRRQQHASIIMIPITLLNIIIIMQRFLLLNKKSTISRYSSR